MRLLLVIVLAAACSLHADDRMFAPKVGPHETPVLEDGEIAVVVYPDGEPIGVRVGDGSATGGRWLYDARAAVKKSPINPASESDFTVTLGGSAYWTNGLVSMFPPSVVYAAVSGVVTVRLVSADQRIKDVRPASVGTDYSLVTKVSAAGDYAVITAHPNDPPYFGGTAPTKECYVERFEMDVYADRASVGATQDFRGYVLLVPYPEKTRSTNNESFYPVTMGWYSQNVQTAVAQFSDHPAAAKLVLRNGMQLDDGISMQQRFQWTYRPNGFLSLDHVSDSRTPVMSVEAIDPWPWIVAPPTGNVFTLQWTTNGIAGQWAIQTAASASGPWTNALILATNTAPPGYASMTASNRLTATAAFCRVVAVGGVQAAAKVRFGPVVEAPAFAFSGATNGYLRWTGSELQLVSNGVPYRVNLTHL